MSRQVTFKEDYLSLVGRELVEGSLAPNFVVTSKELKDFHLSDLKNTIKVIHTFPSLDTSMCDSQVKEFNRKAKELEKNITVLGISNDLPFAQKRFCDEFDINEVEIFSDYKTSSFGINYGLLIKELNLLARAAIILDENNVIRYIQIAGEVSDSLNYEELFNKLIEVSETPISHSAKSSYPSRCVPCEGKGASLSLDKIKELLKGVRQWELVEGSKITKTYKFKDFIEAKYFLDLIAIVSEEQGHHPVLVLNYNVLKVSLFTHSLKGLTNNDFVIAKIIDELMV